MGRAIVGRLKGVEEVIEFPVRSDMFTMLMFIDPLAP